MQMICKPYANGCCNTFMGGAAKACKLYANQELIITGGRFLPTAMQLIRQVMRMGLEGVAEL